nr:pre-mRNA splicing Prp18-interacting factor [Tanacetum cinerariifolium]
MSTFVLCVECGEPLYGFLPCRWCTCERCVNDLLNGFCSRNSCIYDPNLNSFDCPLDSYHPPHPTYETYSSDSYGNDSHFDYDCQPQFPLNYESEPGYIENYNSYPYDSSSFPQQYLYCEDCGDLPEIDQHHFNAESDLVESLPNRDSSIIPSSSKIDSLLDEFADELTLLKSIPSGVDKTDCYYENEIRLTKRLLYDNTSPRLPEEFVSKNSNANIESFSPSTIPVEDSDSRMEEIDVTFTPDDPMPSSIEEDDYDSERDILIREELLDNYSLSLPENESFHFDIPSFSRPPAKPQMVIHEF